MSSRARGGARVGDRARSARNRSRRRKAASRSPARSSSRIARTSNRVSRAGSCGRLRTARYRNEDELYRLANGVDWKRHFAVDRTLRVDVAATRSPLAEHRIRDAQDQGRDLRPLSRRVRQAPVGRQANGRTRGSTRTSPAPTRRSISTRRAKRCSSADGAATPTPRRCARTSPPAFWRSPDGRRQPRCSIRCAAPGRSRSKRRSRPPIARRDCNARSASRSSRGTTARHGSESASARMIARGRRRRSPTLFASDIDSRAVAQCRRNIEAAGLAGWIRRRRRPTCSPATAPAPSGLLVTNPPYGVRLDDAATLAAFYPKLGDALKQRYRRMDGVPAERRHAAAEADRPEAVETNAALQRCDRMPALPVRARRGTAARARRTRRSRPPDDKIRSSTRRRRTTLRHADAPCPTLRIGTHAVHPRAEAEEALARARAADKAARSGGTSFRRISPKRRRWTRGAFRSPPTCISRRCEGEGTAARVVGLRYPFE